MRSMDNKTSIKIEISSRMVEGGQTEKYEGEKMDQIDEGDNDDLDHLWYYFPISFHFIEVFCPINLINERKPR